MCVDADNVVPDIARFAPISKNAEAPAESSQNIILSSFGSVRLSKPRWESDTVALPLVAPPDSPVPATTAVISPALMSEYLASLWPPPVEPSCTRIVSSVVSTESSPTAPVKASFCDVVPLLNCTCVGIFFS